MEEKTLDLPGALWLGVLTGLDGPIAATGPAGPKCLGVGAGVGGQAGRRSQEAPGPRGRMGSALEAYGQRRFRGLRGALLGLGGGQGRPAGEEGGQRAQRPSYRKRAAELRPLEGAWGGHCAPGARARLGSGCGAQGRRPYPSRRCGGAGEGRGRGAWRRSALHCGGGNRFQDVFLLLAQRALLALGSEHFGD